MSYWKYRAFDEQLRIQNGVLISHISGDEPPDHIFLALRQQGLQGVELEQIDSTTYNREIYLLKLKERGSPKPKKVHFNVSQGKPGLSIHGRIWALVCFLASRCRKRPNL